LSVQLEQGQSASTRSEAPAEAGNTTPTNNASFSDRDLEDLELDSLKAIHEFTPTLTMTRAGG
jgi:hypothetical protein